METMKTRGQMEAEISEAIITFEKESMGRGPLEVRSHVIDDMVLVRLKSVLTPLEVRLVETEDPRQGRDLIKQVRMELLELGRPKLESAIQELTGCLVESLHTDVSTRTGERIIVFTLKDQPLYREKGQAKS
jgi:uncharacterized protein YbcI